MSETNEFTVRELCSYLLGFIENGDGDKIVQLSINYDHCDHIQRLRKIYNIDGLDWITLSGGS